MADVRLGRYEAREGGLPPVCICCAGPASVLRKKTFVKRSPWLYALVAVCWPALPVLWFLGDRVLVRAPFCELHKNHWLGRTWLVFAAVAVDVVLAVTGVVLALQYWGQHHPLRDLSLLLGTLGLILGPPAILALALTLKYTAIYPREITRHSITLTGAPDEFVEAVRVARQREPASSGNVVPQP
jgi:hypothetical protein